MAKYFTASLDMCILLSHCLNSLLCIDRSIQFHAKYYQECQGMALLNQKVLLIIVIYIIFLDWQSKFYKAAIKKSTELIIYANTHVKFVSNYFK